MGQINFKTISTLGLTPRHATEFDTTSGTNATADTTQFLLLVGQMGATSPTAANVLVDLYTESDAAAAFGDGCMLDLMGRAAFTAYPYARVSAIGVADAGGAVAATDTITFGGGAATTAGAVETLIAGVLVRSKVDAGDTEAVIAAHHIVDINALVGLPVTALINGGNNKRIDLTAKNKGTHGNKITLASSLTVAGIGTTVTIGGSLFSSGVTDPDLTAALAATAAKRFHKIAIGLIDANSTSDARDFVKQQSDADHEKGCVAIQAITSQLSDATGVATGVDHERNVVFWMNGTDSLPCEVAAACAAVMTAEPNPARPFNTVVVAGLKVPPTQRRPIRTETDAALGNGVSPLVVNAAGEVTIMRAVTTRVLNAQGTTDLTLLDVMTIQCFDWLRDNINLMIETRYARSNVADDDSASELPPDVVTPSKFKVSLLNVAREREAEGVCQHVEALASLIDVERVGTTLRYALPADFVPGLMQVFGKIVNFTKTLPA